MNKWVKANDNGTYVIRNLTGGTFFDFKTMTGSSSEMTPTGVTPTEMKFSLDRNLLLSCDVDNLAKTLNRELSFICNEVDDSVGTNLAMEFIKSLTEDSTRWLVKTASELAVNFIIHVSYVDDYEFSDCATFSEDADDFYQEDHECTDSSESVIVATAWVSSVLDFTISEHNYAHYVLKWGVPINA